MGNNIVIFVNTKEKPTNSKYGEWKEADVCSPINTTFKLNSNVKWEGDIHTIDCYFAGYLVREILGIDYENYNGEKIEWDIWYNRDTADHDDLEPLDVDGLCTVILRSV